MGNEESRHRASEERPASQYRSPAERPAPINRVPQPQPRNQFSEAQVARLLEAQKQHFDKKVEEIIKTQSAFPPTRVTTQNVAGSSTTQANLAGKQTTRPSSFTTPSQSQSVAASSTAQAASFVKSANTPPSSGVTTPTHQRGPSPMIISSVNVERSRAPYNYSQSQLKQTTGQTLYPNLNTLQTQNNPCASKSDFVFVNKSGNVERQGPVPSAPPAPRDRSCSRTRSRNDDNQDQVKCPTCKRLYGLTIFQCPSGHSSCEDCKKARRVCGLCYRPIGDMRNIMMEQVVAEMKVKCPNTDDGCHLFIKLADMQNHAKECPFREMPCPLTSISGCLWKGKLAQVASHFDSVHPMNRQAAVDTEMSHMNIQNNCHVAHLVVIGAFNFIFHLIVSKTEGKVYMAVQLIGTNISASKWTYDIHVYHKGQPRRKFQYADVCTPVNTNIGEIMSVAQCAVLPLSYASTFICDNKLTYKFYIKKEYEKPFGNNRGRGRGRGGHRK